MEPEVEPQEVIERTVEHHHHAQGHKTNLMVPAIAAAILAVFAALAAVLSGHAANQAILLQTQASDQWAYYQAKSTKGHLYEVGSQIVAALADQTRKGAEAMRAAEGFRAQVSRYDEERKELQEKAEHLEAESQHEFHKHHQFALSIAAFQVGIVLSSISILVGHRSLFVLSLVAGLIGLALAASGVFA